MHSVLLIFWSICYWVSKLLQQSFHLEDLALSCFQSVKCLKPNHLKMKLKLRLFDFVFFDTIIFQADTYNKVMVYLCIMDRIWKLAPVTMVLLLLLFPFSVVSKCPSSYFLMEIVFVRSDEARRGSVETGPLRFISGPQSVFCLASWCAAWTCRLQGHSWVPLPAPPPTNNRHSWSTAFSCAND